MRTALLRRTHMGDTGTFGVLEFEGEKFQTGELPARGNAHDVSSIPAGVYTCRWTLSNRFKRETYQVLDVPGRTGVRFHPANLMGDTTKGLKSELNGCIALGYARGPVTIEGHVQEGVLSSRAATAKFEKMLGGQDFQLAIIDEYLEAGAPPAVA